MVLTMPDVFTHVLSLYSYNFVSNIISSVLPGMRTTFIEWTQNILTLGLHPQCCVGKRPTYASPHVQLGPTV